VPAIKGCLLLEKGDGPVMEHAGALTGCFAVQSLAEHAAERVSMESCLPYRQDGVGAQELKWEQAFLAWRGFRD